MFFHKQFITKDDPAYAGAELLFDGVLCRVLLELGVRKAHANWVGEVLRAAMFTSEERYYHTGVHVLAMFDFAEEHKIELTPTEQLAILFHDAVYDPQEKLITVNEEASSDFLRALLWNKIDRRILKNAITIVRQTAMHGIEQEALECLSPTVMDLDLSTFAYEYYWFEKLQSFICEEFGLTREKYTQLRNPFVKRLFTQKYGLYRTEAFEKFSEIAKQNEEQFLHRQKEWIGEE